MLALLIQIPGVSNLVGPWNFDFSALGAQHGSVILGSIECNVVVDDEKFVTKFQTIQVSSSPEESPYPVLTITRQAAGAQPSLVQHSQHDSYHL